MARTQQMDHYDAESTDGSGQRNTLRGEYVYQQLRDGIQSGRFKPGDRLREEEVASALGVSRTPVRDALRRLQTHGLLEFVVGKGLVVVQLTAQQVAELYAVSELLDGAAASLAAQHAGQSDIELLKDLQAEFLANISKPDALARINRDFHQAIIDAARNRYLARPMRDHGDALALLPDNTHSVRGRARSAYAEHQAIVAAIADRDPARAEAAARAHVRSTSLIRLKMARA